MERISAAATASIPKPKGGRKSAALPPETVEYLKNWMMSPEHIAHPYPTEQEKAEIMAETGIGMKQLTNWFVNNRKRYWRPRVANKKVSSGSIPRSSSTGSLPMKKRGPKPQQVTSSSSSSSVSKVKHSFCPVQARASLIQALNAMAYDQQNEEDPHTVSDGSSAGSDDDSVDGSSSSSSTNNNFLTIVPPAKCFETPCLANAHKISSAALNELAGGYKRYEEVDVHILRPEGSTEEEPLPTIRDLTIKSSVPKERILATFKCPISYTVPYEIEHDKKKVQSRRDGEVLKVKKHYLKLYLATRGIHSASSPLGKDINKEVPNPLAPSSTSLVPSTSETAPADEVSSPGATVISPIKATSSTSFQVSTMSRSRAFTIANLDESTTDTNPVPRKRARTESGSFLKGEEEWRELCKSAKSFYCDELPSLDDAAMMFGYSLQ
jgi:hypothetical protein